MRSKATSAENLTRRRPHPNAAASLLNFRNPRSESADLAARIRAEHEAVIIFMKKGLERAIRAGELLLEAKAQIGKHGQWLP